MIYLALIEDDELVRNHLASYFSRVAEVKCALVARSIEDFFEKVVEVQQLDIVLSDIGLPGRSGIEAIPDIKRKFPNVSIVMLSVYFDNDGIFKAFFAGAVGYLQKDTAMEELLDCFTIINKEGSVLFPIIPR